MFPPTGDRDILAHFVAISAKIHFNVLFRKEKFRLFHFISDRGEVDAHVVVVRKTPGCI